MYRINPLEPEAYVFPARPQPAYIHFARLERRSLAPNAKNISTILSQRWKELSPRERSCYTDMENADRYRYEIEAQQRDEMVDEQTCMQQCTNCCLQPEQSPQRAVLHYAHRFIL